jgi:translation initiation factor IF-2
LDEDMADTETQDKDAADGKKKLSLSKPSKLTLNKTIEGGQVRQSFSHGRSKTVAVEVRKKRTFAPNAGGAMREVHDEDAEAAFEAATVTAEAAVAEQTPAETRGGTPVEPHLTDHERAQRVRALQDARKADEERVAREEELARERAEEDKRRKAELAARGEEEEKVEAKAPEASASAPSAKPAPGAQAVEPAPVADDEDSESDAARAARGKVAPRRPATPPVARRGEPRRRSGKLTITDALEDNERVRSLASMRRAREKQKKKELPGERIKVLREVTIPETITVNELANRMAERSIDVVRALMKMGVIAAPEQSIDADTAELVVSEFGHKFKRVAESDVEIGLRGETDIDGDMLPRSPVVTVMGHVDHGKTSLLDALRQTDVVSGEAGGITQHIGAYQVKTAAGGVITFIDTPGHEAFTAMRQRGAKVTDIVILVVAADDGIMPQTIEAIAHAKAAQVPIIVAINKIDKPEANPIRVRTQLLEHELVVESMGGDVQEIEVSALKKMNLDKLEEAILLQAEVMDLRANPNRAAEGVVIESRVEQGRGAVATVLVQRGTLKVGDILVAGGESGRVRTLSNDRGENIKTAGPSEPVEITGLNAAPNAGDEVFVVENEARAREVAAFRQSQGQKTRNAISARGTLEEMFTAIKAGETKELPVVIKADVQGSVEAISQMLLKIPGTEVKVRILHAGVGAVNESDVALAGASGGVIIGFNVRANKQARDESTRNKVDIRYYSVIYDIGDDMKNMIVGLMKPEIRETWLGNAEVLQVFTVSKVGKVAGCRVNEGIVRRGSKVRLLRDNVVIHEGKLSTLKHFKDEVREVRQGSECGMSFENYNDIREGDVIECFDVQEVAPTL